MKNAVTTKLNPTEGLKRRQRAGCGARAGVTTKLNPTEGLKLSGLMKRRIRELGHNQAQPNRGIETVAAIPPGRRQQ
jgi:hypothetical protein